MNVICIDQTQMLCLSNEVQSVEDNLGSGNNLGMGGGTNSESARVKGNTVDWDDDWSE